MKEYTGSCAFRKLARKQAAINNIAIINLLTETQEDMPLLITKINTANTASEFQECSEKVKHLIKEYSRALKRLEKNIEWFVKEDKISKVFGG